MEILGENSREFKFMKDQIVKAQKSLAKQAKNSPWLFPAYHDYQQSLSELRSAKKKVEDARIKWYSIRYINTKFK